MDSIPEQWSLREIEMVNVVDVFHHKPAIMKKAESYLAELKARLVLEIAPDCESFPPGVDVAKGQFARGENHKGFPFISMDMPQQFSKTEMFTYRTLFWWGHYLGFAFMLKGERLPDYMDRLIARKATPASADIYFACNASPWEWGWTEENFKLLSATPAAEVRKTIADIQYIKLCQFYPLDGPDFASLDWAATGLGVYRAMTGLFLSP